MINVYACGGAGGNIGKQIKNLDMDVFFIDTSNSNLKDIKTDNVYLVEGMDGAGKRRATTYEGFKGLAEEVLIRFKPSTDLNVVVSSLSGGSGSILSPLLVKELIANGSNTIVIGVDSRSSVIEIDNTISTLKTFKSISDAVDRSISLFYVENSSRKEADKKAINLLELLALLVNKELTEEFDTSDVHNFINYDKVTDNEPGVAILEVNANETILPEKGTTIVSTVLLTKDTGASINPAIPEYLATCIVTDPNYSLADIRMDNVLGKLVHLVKDLEEQSKELKDNKRINKHQSLEVDNANSDGIVF